MTIDLAVRHRQGKFSLEADFSSNGRLIALFGPSGSGKTTLVNLIGGLMRPDEGRIVVGDRVLADTSRRLFLPAHKRRIGYVFQDARLFPHLNVAQNLRYGRYFTPKGENYADLGAVVDLLGIGHLLDRRPGLLSGGEKQRVAIGRALLASPKLILMDEPLASLDEARKAEILPYIERLRDETKIPIVYVSHSMAEVARLATDVVALSAGRVVASGPVAKVLPHLDLPTADDPGGMSAVIDAELIQRDDGYGLSVLRSLGGEWRVGRVKAEPGSRLRLRVRARDVMLALKRPEAISALNVMSVSIVGIEKTDRTQALVRLDCGGDELVAQVTRRSVETLELKPGMEAFAVVKTVTFDPAGAAILPT